MAESEEQRKAELLLAKLADRLVMSGLAPFLITTIVFEIILILAGLWVRTFLAPHGWEVAAAWELLAAFALAAPSLKRRTGKKEPEWVQAASAHERSAWGRLPEDMRVMLREFTGQMTAGTRWRGDAHVYIAQCADEEGVHYAPCCAGGTLVLNGRLLVILGEHLAAGPVATAQAVLAHERRHVSGWQLHVYALASILGTWGLVIVGWSVTPWPVMLLAVAGLRAARTATAWMIEISCDTAGARETSPAAMVASLEFKLRTTGGTRALYSRWKRLTMTVLRCLVWPTHPPHSVRCTAIRTLARL